MILKFRLLTEDAIAPTRKHDGDAGLDVYSNETITIASGDQTVVRTGVALADAPSNIVIQVWPKSGLDAQYGITTGAGVIDSGYRGEVLILIRNMGLFSYTIEKGSQIAQLLVVPVMRPLVVIASKGTKTLRGATGGIVFQR